MTNPATEARSRSGAKISLLLLLLALMAIGAVPGYLSGKWSWVKPPRVKTLKQLREIRKQGLNLPGWETLVQQVVTIGGHKWSYQQIQSSESQKVLLLLLNQNDHVDQPRVEWVDINGHQQQMSSDWKTDSYQTKQFTITPTDPGETVKVRSRFFRGWNQRQTYAILQWYARPDGGSTGPTSWFWADRMAMVKGDRSPWVAVCLLIPIEPLGDIEQTWPQAKELAETVQTTLMAGPFKYKTKD
ncbi:MAG: cyanoexosortase B system-associated protein [Hormoscilla sp.]